MEYYFSKWTIKRIQTYLLQVYTAAVITRNDEKQNRHEYNAHVKRTDCKCFSAHNERT